MNPESSNIEQLCEKKEENQGVPSEREVAFIALRYLWQFPCKETVQLLADKLCEQKLLPLEYDWKGQCRTVSFTELLKTFSFIDENFLRDSLAKALPTSPHPVSTFLGSGSRRTRKRKKRIVSCVYLFFKRSSERMLFRTDSWPSVFLHKNTKKLKTLVGHTEPIYCITFDSSSRYLITGADDNLVKIWSVETGYLQFTLKYHEGDITDLAVHPWKPVLITASNDSRLCVWNLKTGVLLNVLEGHTGEVNAVTFCRSPDRPFVVSGGADGTFRLWNADCLEVGPVVVELKQFQPFRRRIYDYEDEDDLLMSFDTEQETNHETNEHTTEQGNGFSVVDASTHEVTNVPSAEEITPTTQIVSVEFNNGGTLLALGATDRRVYLFSITFIERLLPEVTHLSTLKGHTAEVYQVRFSHRGERLISGARDSTARVWKRKNRHGTQWTSIVLHMRQEIGSYNIDSNAHRSRRASAPIWVNCLLWSHDDKLVITASSDRKVRVWNSTTGQLLHCLCHHEAEIYVLDLHSFDKRIILTADYNSRIVLWDIEQGVVLKEFDLSVSQMPVYASSVYTVEHRILDGCFSPNGIFFAISDDSGAVTLFGPGNGENTALAPEQQFFTSDFVSAWTEPENRNNFSNLSRRSLLCDIKGTVYPPTMQPVHIFQETISELSDYTERKCIHSYLVARAEASRQVEREEQERLAREERARAREAAIARLREEMRDSDSEDSSPSPTNIRQRLRKRVSRGRRMIEYTLAASSASSSDPELTYSTSDYCSASDETTSEATSDNSEISSNVVEGSWDELELENEYANKTPRKLRYNSTSYEGQTINVRSKRKRARRRGSSSKAKSSRYKADSSEESRNDRKQVSRSKHSLAASEWLRAVSNDPCQYEYVPQVDDEVYYFPKGHLNFIRAEGFGQDDYVELEENFNGGEAARKLKICSVTYLHPKRKRGRTISRLEVASLEESEIDSVRLTLDYMFSEQVPDFLVMISRVEKSLNRHWRVGERFRTVYIGPDGHKSFYHGTVRSVLRSMYREPWNSICVEWDADGTQEYLSPWELMEPVEEQEETPLQEPWSSMTEIWENAFQQNEELGEICSPFFVSLEELASFPGYTDMVALPMNLEIVYLRLKNRFYRSIEALKSDLVLIRDNCMIYNEDGSSIQSQANQMYNELLSLLLNDGRELYENNSDSVNSNITTRHKLPRARKRVQYEEEKQSLVDPFGKMAESSNIENKPLAGKKAVITGGNKGIGAAISIAFAQKGADIAILARDADSAQNVVKKVRSERQFCKMYPTDLSDSEALVKTAKDILKDLGRVDILVNNAGMSELEPLVEFSDANWERTMNVNLKAPFILSREFAKGMIERKSGKIIHISSVASFQAVDQHAAYCVSKAGLNMLTKVMALEWGPYNVQTNAIAPTVVWTEMGQRVWGAPEKHEPMLARIPAHRFVKPEEVAELASF
eukprot:jgi/Galph1/6092/GphlegSOOS_G4662.1